MQKYAILAVGAASMTALAAGLLFGLPALGKGLSPIGVPTPDERAETRAAFLEAYADGDPSAVRWSDRAQTRLVWSAQIIRRPSSDPITGYLSECLVRDVNGQVIARCMEFQNGASYDVNNAVAVCGYQYDRRSPITDLGTVKPAQKVRWNLPYVDQRPDWCQVSWRIEPVFGIDTILTWLVSVLGVIAAIGLMVVVFAVSLGAGTALARHAGWFSIATSAGASLLIALLIVLRYVL